MPVKDYGYDYPNGVGRTLAEVTYEELMSGSIEIDGKATTAVPLTSYSRSLEIANELKRWIDEGSFLLTEPVAEIDCF
jgi:uncharacterized protein (DUF39 family)